MTTMLAVAVLILSGCRRETAQEGPGGPAHLRPATSGTEFFRAGTETEAVPVQVPEGVTRFFERAGVASRSTVPIEARDFFSLDAMVAAIGSLGVLQGMAPQEREAFRKGFEDGIVRSGNLFQQIAWDSHRIRRVEEIVDGRLLVYVRHYDNEINVTHNIRWWLLPDGDGGWKAYDFEDVSFGLSAVGLMGSLARNALAADPVPWVEQVVRLGRTMQDWDPDDEAGTAALTALLDEIGTQDMPLEFRRYVSVVRATFHLQRGDPSASIRELDAAIQAGHAGLQHDYVRGQAMLSARRYEDALSALQRYADQVGWDSDVLEAVSDAHLMLGNRELAREAALRGLADNPSAVHCLASLAAASEVDQIRQPSFREHFHRSGMADTGYEVALDYLLDLERLPQAHALFARFKEDFPDHPLLSFYTEELSGK